MITFGKMNEYCEIRFKEQPIGVIVKVDRGYDTYIPDMYFATDPTLKEAKTYVSWYCQERANFPVVAPEKALGEVLDFNPPYNNECLLCDKGYRHSLAEHIFRII